MSRSSKLSFWTGCVILILTGCNRERTVEVEIVNAAPYKVTYEITYPSENGSQKKAGTLKAGGIETFKTTFKGIKPSFTISGQSADEEKEFLRWHFGLPDSDSATRRITLGPFYPILPTDTNKSVFRHVIADGSFPSIYLFDTNYTKMNEIAFMLMNEKNKPYRCAANARLLNKELKEKFANRYTFKFKSPYFLNSK